MSFMFKPFPYDDPEAVNRFDLPQGFQASVVGGNELVAQALCKALPDGGILFLDGYIGAPFQMLCDRIAEVRPDTHFLPVADAYKSSEELDEMLAPSLPTDRDIDPILLFGKCHHFEVESLFSETRLSAFAKRLEAERKSSALTVVYGNGCAIRSLRPLADAIAYLDVNALHATLRIRARKCRNLGDSQVRPLPEVLRRMYYYDYEIMMQHRDEALASGQISFYIDSNRECRLKSMPGDKLQELLDQLAARPFRCTPVYLEGVWGGHFVQKLRHLPADMKNCAWVFDMIPNEVSVQVQCGVDILNLPFTMVFKQRAESIIGPECTARFGKYFPIRFNYDDTYGGTGNMSIQVHPPKAYNNEHFGEPFQQDESYYCVKTAGSRTYLGLQDDCNVPEFFECIHRAEQEHIPFDHDKYVNSFPSEEGDQFLLPGGTIHASGRNQVVLEIGSYTIGSYTFKLYDYLRKDLDGNPRPIHSRHGENVLVTERRRSAVDGVLRPSPRLLRSGEGWKEELLGEHDLIYFSLRRLSFNHAVQDSTKGAKFHTLVLTKGDEILIYSRCDPARCYHAKYMDMVLVPASVGEYGIINLGTTPCEVHKTMLKEE